MSVTQEERKKAFSTKIAEGLEEMTKDVVVSVKVSAAQLTEILVKEFGAELAELTSKARTLDNIVAIAKITQITPDVRPEELWRKTRATLEGDGLL